MKDIASRHWPSALTVVALTAAVGAFAFLPNMNSRSQLGDFLSGFASTVAFIWLVAAYRLQARELRLQREELALQRQALELQREELKKLGKFAGLEQIARMLEQFDQSLASSPAGTAKSAAQLPAAFTNGMSLWKAILESKDPHVVLDAYMKWMPIFLASYEFTARIAAAADLYCEAAGVAPVRPDLEPPERVYFAYEEIKSIPHISAYIGAAYGIATNLVLMSPGVDRIKLAGLEATEKVFPGVTKDDAVAALKARVKAHDESVAREKAKRAT